MTSGWNGDGPQWTLNRPHDQTKPSTARLTTVIVSDIIRVLHCLAACVHPNYTSTAMHLLYHLNSWLFPLLLVSSTLAYPKAPTSNSPRPMVLWHGLGDSHSSPGMLEFISKVKEVHPGIFIHSIYIEEDLSEDQRAGTVRTLLSNGPAIPRLMTVYMVV